MHFGIFLTPPASFCVIPFSISFIFTLIMNKYIINKNKE